MNHASTAVGKIGIPQASLKFFTWHVDCSLRVVNRLVYSELSGEDSAMRQRIRFPLAIIGLAVFA